LTSSAWLEIDNTMNEPKQELISKALRWEIPAEHWMVESRTLAAHDADGYGNMMGCEAHVSLATENFQEAEKLKDLISNRE
jgi:hypothetical protein